MVMLTGSLVAMVTPMASDGSVDYPALEQLVDFHIENGTSAIVSVGTTGESATLSVKEHVSVIEATVKHAAGRIPVVAGAGANATSEAIELTQQAQRVGAQAVLSVVPYYNKPTQEGLCQHFMAIAEQGGLPVILYNVPSRTVVDMQNETVLRLAEHPNIIGIKDATGSLARACELIARAPKGFALYTGEDAVGLAFMLCGGHGVISVTANVAPKLMSQMCQAALSGQNALARELNDQLQALHKHLFIESNPIPAKWALARIGKIQDKVRLPLVSLSATAQPKVEMALKVAGLL